MIGAALSPDIPPGECGGVVLSRPVAWGILFIRKLSVQTSKLVVCSRQEPASGKRVLVEMAWFPALERFKEEVCDAFTSCSS